jgi:hypothetical protein
MLRFCSSHEHSAASQQNTVIPQQIHVHQSNVQRLVCHTATLTLPAAPPPAQVLGSRISVKNATYSPRMASHIISYSPTAPNAAPPQRYTSFHAELLLPLRPQAICCHTENHCHLQQIHVQTLVFCTAAHPPSSATSCPGPGFTPVPVAMVRPDRRAAGLLPNDPRAAAGAALTSSEARGCSRVQHSNEMRSCGCMDVGRAAVAVHGWRGGCNCYYDHRHAVAGQK